MKIDQTLFMVVFRRDVGFHDAFSQSTYLDRRTGIVALAGGTATGFMAISGGSSRSAIPI